VWNGKNHSNPLLSKLRDLPRRVCYDSVIEWCVRVWNGKKNYLNPLLSKLRDFLRRVVCSGVFVVRTQKSFVKVFVVRFVRCPNCSLTGHLLYCCLILREVFVTYSYVLLLLAA